jgi:hypothetical protein
VAGDDEGAALQFAACERLAESGDLRHRFLPDLVRVVLEVDLEIDARPFLGDDRDLLTLGGRERARRPVAQAVYES